MSSSEGSDSDVQVEEIPEEQQKHIKQILNKGKEIVPFYDDATLLSLYKQYYSIQKVFYSELEVIANRRKAQAQNKNTWITVGKTSARRERIQTGKYNFLQDKQLIRKAKAHNDRQNIRESDQAKPHFRERDHTENEYQRARPYRQQNNNQSFKKHQYKEKPVQKTHDNNKKDYKYRQKDQKVQKNQNPPSSVVKLQENSNSKQNQKKETSQSPAIKQEKSNVKTNSNTNEEEKVKGQSSTQQKANNENRESQEETKNKKKPKYVEKQKKQSEPVEKLKKQSEPVEKKQQPSKQISKSDKQEKKEQSEKLISKSDAQERFQKQCQKNPDILKFLHPADKIQKISYTLVNGELTDVKTRLTANS